MTGYQGTLQARLVAKLTVNGPDECWIWNGAMVTHGYGQITEGGAAGAKLLAHRAAYEVFIGPIPDGMVVDHECHNVAVLRGECNDGGECIHRRCCNPWHLAAKSQAQNLAGGSHDHSTGEFCANGHPNSEYRHRSPNGQTYCRKCRADYKRASREREAVRTQRERITKGLDVRPIPGPKKPRTRKKKEETANV